MATSRRAFCAAALGAAGLVTLTPAHGYPPVGYLATAGRADGRYSLVSIASDGRVARSLVLPGRGHAVAVHPAGREAVVFARRPGTFAIVADLESWTAHEIAAPAGRHFYGHGVHSADGRLLFATENAIDSGRGVIGVYDPADGYRRIDEFESRGIGPHEIIRDGGLLVVANGGIRTHPDTGRLKLNLEAMRSSLVWLDSRTGEAVHKAALPEGLGRLSLRHLAPGRGGSVFAAGQWEGAFDSVPPLLWRAGSAAAALEPVFGDTADARALRGYIGSVAVDRSGEHVAVTSPRAGLVKIWNLASGREVHAGRLPDASGLAPGLRGGEFLVSAGTGRIVSVDTGTGPGSPPGTEIAAGLQWDNHMIFR